MFTETRLKIPSPHLNVMVTACFQAAKGLVRDFGEIDLLQVSRKGLGDFVSKADHRSEKTIVDTLKKARPHYSFRLEESGEIKGTQPEYCWIVDPLDGTTNFINAVPHFCISIGLTQNDELICGVVYDPIKDELFYAQKGCGAYVNSHRLRVSSRTTLEDALVAFSLARPTYKGSFDFYTLLPTVQKPVASVRCFGAAALDLCYVAAGRFDAYWALELQPWDMAAGALIVKEAGGFITDLKGAPDFMTTRHILAGNEAIYSHLLPLFK